tara:strand:- start:1111 stop:1293 length:183 start_codon:yes stop_codon:yes gene_type:complete
MSKVGFGNTINSLNDDSRTSSECHKYGIISGCDPFCPIFERGECELQEENKKQFLEEGLL